jgi:hypothetical protein
MMNDNGSRCAAELGGISAPEKPKVIKGVEGAGGRRGRREG